MKKTLKEFKRLILPILIIFLFSNVQLFAQYPYSWTEPASLTDSLSNNCNPDIKRIYENGQEKLFMAWEKSFDSLSTAIYMKDIAGSNTEIEVLSNPGIHYTHPKIFSFNYYGSTYDTLFYLFYQTNQLGNQDIKYLIYTSDGNFSEPQEFFNSNGDEHAFDCNSNYEIVWLSDEELFYTRYNSSIFGFDTPVGIDNAGCFNPKIDLNNYIFWEKKEDSESHIYKSTKQGLNLWSDPELIYDSGYAANLNKDAMEFGLMTWGALIDSVWKVLVCITWYDDITEYDFESNEEIDPAITQWVLGVKSTGDYWECYVTFPHEENGFDEIYVNPDPGANFINLSNSGTQNRNPNTFYGEDATYDCFYVYDVWESWQNDHWQLFHSKIMMCIGGVGEHELNNHYIQVSPNPFSDELKISYKLKHKSNVRVDILDLNGKLISSLIDENQNKGEHSIAWKSNQNISPGIYIIRLQNNDQIYNRKIIKSN